ncbi:YdcF family SAM-binding protein [Candidatus Mancarchaeum acidiphilum]|uniref:YdcF family SAM-binding protein n=1 Tax=Candidatus Mancarchaeum acidiphilum TaxID=1920749 RepID=A0A218NN02_9ARCH|nr:YdcF family protein [Candidatus Mancarchaeum acidiphilum]ASI13845.1 YdcF family SAM-binding protein [Candidatus Mancarchaeum acidiphilum]
MQAGSKIAVVLGSKQYSDSDIDDELKGRLSVAQDLFKNGSISQVIVSGGTTNPSINMSEAEIMENYLVSIGVPNDKIIKEESALDTIGNAYFSMLKLNGLSGISTVYIVTSCWHMKRSKYIFEMTFGDKYKMNFDHCFDYHDEDLDNELQEHEKKSMALAEKFFEGITPGDMEEIKYRLYKFHEYYKK